ncbi:MAG: cytochrome c [Xanthobacteraceae bacterium]|jgi:mono/diheme cytochrome c family protein
MRRILPRYLKVIGVAPLAAMLALASLPAHGDEVLSPAAQRGYVLLHADCAGCHAIGKVDDSPLKIAPPFRTLHLHYPVENLQEPLAEGIITGHPTMPEFRYDPGQVADVIGYLKSLER